MHDVLEVKHSLSVVSVYLASPSPKFPNFKYLAGQIGLLGDASFKLSWLRFALSCSNSRFPSAVVRGGQRWWEVVWPNYASASLIILLPLMLLHVYMHCTCTYFTTIIAMKCYTHVTCTCTCMCNLSMSMSHLVIRWVGRVSAFCWIGIGLPDQAHWNIPLVSSHRLAVEGVTTICSYACF